ncbi:MAG TPA: DUF4395 family protein [Candidatus Udaeobacter sp.]|nr:DUF4395 family protein [Candidatus Udaeobacter sp.]
MMQKNISEKTFKRLIIQGYGRYAASELAGFWLGLRFPYVACGLLAAVGVYLINIPTLFVLMVVAFLGIFLSYHPFDYGYNYFLRYLFKSPKLPPRSAQIKFACGIATGLLGATIFLFWQGFIATGIILGSVMIFSAILVTITDICIPSMIYNWLHRNKLSEQIC